MEKSKEQIWEQFISINSDKIFNNGVLPAVKEYYDINNTDYDMADFIKDNAELIDNLVNTDVAPLPKVEDREGYYKGSHFNYWISGLIDVMQIDKWMARTNSSYKSVLDLGCASGRLVRHFHNYKKVETYGCDINRMHVDWVAKYLPMDIIPFQNTSIPHINLPDNSVDLVTAYSIFSHVESFDTAWIMEIKRILKPNGIAWLTVNNDRVWNNMNNCYPLYNSLIAHDPNFSRDTTDFSEDRLIFRYYNSASYTSHVFYKNSYLLNTWGRILKHIDNFPAIPKYQEVFVFKKI